MTTFLIEDIIKVLKANAPLIAISISLVALIISIYNSTISRRSFGISKKQYQNKLSLFGFYLIESFSIKQEKERFLIFHITVTNKSETKNSFSATLNLEYIDDDNFVTKVQLQHFPEYSNKIPKRDFTFFPKQIFVSDKESISKWLLFSYNLELTKNKRIDNYTLNFKDVNGVEQNINTILIKELL